MEVKDLVEKRNAKIFTSSVCGTYICGEIVITVMKDQVWFEICWSGDCKAIAIATPEAVELLKQALKAIEEIHNA